MQPVADATPPLPQEAAPAPAQRADHRVLARRAAIAGGAVVANGLLSAAILALSAAAGQTDQIAAYTVVTSALSLAATIAGGGSALLYVNGTEDERALVRSQWLLVVVPVVLLGTVAVGQFYATRGYSPAALAASGVVVLGNCLAQLQLGDFTRQMRFLASALLMCGSKAASLLLVVLGVPFTVSLATVGIVQLAVGEMVLGREGSLRHIRPKRLSLRRAIVAYGTNRHLFAYAVGDLYVARMATIALSLAASPAVMGSFGAVVTAYQAMGGVVQSALQVPMVARARNRLGIERAQHSTAFSVAVALAAAVPMAAAVAWLSPWLTRTVLHLPHPGAAGWLAVFMLALPFMAVSRSFMLNRIGDGRYGWAMRSVGLLAALLTVAVVIGVPRFGALGAAGATAAAEILTLAILAIALARPGRR